jgi:hypothetical protein
MIKLVVKSPVWDDLRGIGLLIAENNPQAADRFFQRRKSSLVCSGFIQALAGSEVSRWQGFDPGRFVILKITLSFIW